MSVASEAPRRVPALTVVEVLSATSTATIVATPMPVLDLDFGGVLGDRHYGLTRPADTRLLRYYARGTMVRNRRQLTLVSVEELAQVAERLGVPEVRPEWLGANLLVEGIADLTALAMGSRLMFDGGVGLVCEGANQPCRLPALVIQQQFPWSRASAEFVKAAYGRRGIAASVECPGQIRAGDRATVAPPELHLPPPAPKLRVAGAAGARGSRSALGGAERQSGDELLLQQEEHDDGRQRDQHRTG